MDELTEGEGNSGEVLKEKFWKGLNFAGRPGSDTTEMGEDWNLKGPK